MAAAALIALTGCARMDAALARQWMLVDFSPGTSVATALHVRAACSHVQNTRPMALTAKSSYATVYNIAFDTTHASPANVAELQSCLQKFPSVQGVQPMDTGDLGG